MSFSDAIGQIDQIVQWEQQVANPATATQTSGSSGTSTSSQSSGTSATSTSSFADTLAEAQANTEASSATSLLDPTGSSDSTASTDSTDASSALLGGGDSQLLAALQSMEASTSTDTTDSTDSADSLASLESSDSLDGTASTGSSDTELADLASAASQSGTTSDAATALNSADITDTTTSGVTGGQATTSSDPRILAMTEEANALIGKPYVWGGGHDGWASTKGYDCSGFVSAVLHAGGYLSDPQDTSTLPTAGGMEQGPGQYVTIYDRDTPGQEGHVIISINGQFYESGGQHGSWGGGAGVEEISTPSAAYLSTFNNVLHPAGL
jgi:cell wall-associated NlpC family hydrolase